MLAGDADYVTEVLPTSFAAMSVPHTLPSPESCVVSVIRLLGHAAVRVARWDTVCCVRRRTYSVVDAGRPPGVRGAAQNPNSFSFRRVAMLNRAQAVPYCNVHE